MPEGHVTPREPPARTRPLAEQPRFLHSTYGEYGAPPGSGLHRRADGPRPRGSRALRWQHPRRFTPPESCRDSGSISDAPSVGHQDTDRALPTTARRACATHPRQDRGGVRGHRRACRAIGAPDDREAREGLQAASAARPGRRDPQRLDYEAINVDKEALLRGQPTEIVE